MIEFTFDDRHRVGEIAGELEHLPAEIRRHFDQDGRDARFLRKLAERPAGDAEGLREWLRSDEAADVAVEAFGKGVEYGQEGFIRRMRDALAALADSTEPSSYDGGGE